MQVVPEPYTLSESMQRLGEATFDMSFIQAVENIFPSQSSNNSSLINQLTGNTLLGGQSAFNDIWNVSRQYKFNYQAAQSQLNQVAGKFTSVIAPFTSNNTAAAEYQLALLQFKNSINQNIPFASKVSTSLGSLFSTLDQITVDPRQRFNSAQSFFKYGQNTLLPPSTTFQRQEYIANSESINSLMNLSALSNAYNASTEIGFIDENDLNSIEDMLDQQFYYVIDNTIFDDTTLNLLKALRNQVRIFFDNSQLNIRDFIPIQTNQVTITTLTYAYYGELSNDDLITDINKIYVPNNISGNIQILTQQGALNQ